jgi:hypothetical protein
MLERYGSPTLDHPDRFNALVITNYAYHYTGDHIPPENEWLAIVSRYPCHPLPSDRLSELMSAAQGYGLIPNETY